MDEHQARYVNPQWGWTSTDQKTEQFPCDQDTRWNVLRIGIGKTHKILWDSIRRTKLGGREKGRKRRRKKRPANGRKKDHLLTDHYSPGILLPWCITQVLLMPFIRRLNWCFRRFWVTCARAKAWGRVKAGTSLLEDCRIPREARTTLLTLEWPCVRDVLAPANSLEERKEESIAPGLSGEGLSLGESTQGWSLHAPLTFSKQPKSIGRWLWIQITRNKVIVFFSKVWERKSFFLS